MSNYLIALILSVFLASAGGAAYFIKHPDQRPAIQAFVNNNISPTAGGSNTPSPNGVARAPEINASSGINAIAILIGALLLASEKYRVRRS
ncbi:MAG: VPEID-CTERM sorting domain-containing protein [Methylobacter sp.]